MVLDAALDATRTKGKRDSHGKERGAAKPKTSPVSSSPASCSLRIYSQHTEIPQMKITAVSVSNDVSNLSRQYLTRIRETAIAYRTAAVYMPRAVHTLVIRTLLVCLIFAYCTWHVLIECHTHGMSYMYDTARCYGPDRTTRLKIIWSSNTCNNPPCNPISKPVQVFHIIYNTFVLQSRGCGQFDEYPRNPQKLPEP